MILEDFYPDEPTFFPKEEMVTEVSFREKPDRTWLILRVTRKQRDGSRILHFIIPGYAAFVVLEQAI